MVIRRTITAFMSCSEARSSAEVEPRVVETGGTTDAVAWVAVAEIENNTIEVLEVVHYALAQVAEVGLPAGRDESGPFGFRDLD